MGSPDEMPIRLVVLPWDGEPLEPTLRSAGAGVFPFQAVEADGDEAAALNGALEGMAEEWALLLWAGEVVEGGALGLRELLRNATCEVFWAQVLSPTASVAQVRLVRRDIRFQYPIWPQPVLSGEPGQSGLVIRRPSREPSPSWQEDQLRRLQALPERHPHRLYHSIDLLLSLGRFQEIPELVWALEEAEGGCIVIPHGDAYFLGVLTLLGLGRVGEAQELLSRGLEAYPDSTDLNYGLFLLGALQFVDSATLTLDPTHPLHHQVSTTRQVAPQVREFLLSMGLEYSSPQKEEHPWPT